ncbi:MAG: 50S ribosomal protein L11 methyltransferase [Desulfohalobiaceae bacterium]
MPSCSNALQPGSETRQGGPGRMMHAPPQELFIYYLQGRLDPWRVFQTEPDYLGTWIEDNLSFVFFQAPAGQRIQQLLKARPWLSLRDSFRMSYAEWLGHKMQVFQAASWRIIPAWEPEKAVLFRDLLLDPGLVFGTGQHQTTRACLQALDWILQQEAVQSVLDLGTGSGLLSLAAAQAGCWPVLGLDLNPLAARTTRRNTYLNQLQDRIQVLQARAQDYAGHGADILLANIHYQALRQIISAKNLQNKRWLVLSGLLGSQGLEVHELLLQTPGLEHIWIWSRQENWITLVGKMGK